MYDRWWFMWLWQSFETCQIPYISTTETVPSREFDHLTQMFLKRPALLGEVDCRVGLLTTRLYPALFSTQ